jgi:hypothetical protein
VPPSKHDWQAGSGCGQSLSVWHATKVTGWGEASPRGEPQLTIANTSQARAVDLFLGAVLMIARTWSAPFAENHGKWQLFVQRRSSDDGEQYVEVTVAVVAPSMVQVQVCVVFEPEQVSA